jgi:hypothetical protein
MIRWILVSVIGIAAFASVLLIGRNTSPRLVAKEKESQAKSGDVTATPFAVVELFTSEGCSSCPPADRLLGKLVKDAEQGHRAVFALSFHVDYWNKLGWRDPYSDAAFSRRQEKYAEAFKSGGVYTPQMIVNGRAEFVGSDRARARRDIDLALKQPARAAVKLSQGPTKGPASVVFAYEVTGAGRSSVLNVAVVERGLVTEVKRGENGGRTLRHENVVRAFETRPLGEAAAGTVELKVPAELVRGNSSAVAYVQKTDTRAILGATAVELQPSDSR